MAQDAIYEEVEKFQDERSSNTVKLFQKLKWWHIVLAFIFVGLLFYFNYYDVSKTKFSTDEKSLIFNSLTYFNATNQTNSIMPKINNSGHYNPTPLLLTILFFVIIIAWILTSKRSKPLTMELVLKIAERTLENMRGVNRPIPIGTTWEIGPESKLIRAGTMGLQSMNPYKWVTKVLLFYPSGKTQGFLMFFNHPDGWAEGMLKVGKDELDEAYRDLKVVQPKELSLMAMRKGGLPYQFFGSQDMFEK